MEIFAAREKCAGNEATRRCKQLQLMDLPKALCVSAGIRFS